MSFMVDLTLYPNKLNPKSAVCSAIIETPKGRRNKFDYDPKSNLFKLGGLLPEGMAFPFDFGFIPATLSGDGDPLDVMVLMDEPAHVGCLVDVRIIGVIEAKQTQNGKTESNDRLLAVAIHSYSHENVSSIKELHSSLLNQIEQFFVSYNALRGKKFKLTDHHGPKRAVAVIKEGIKSFEKKHPKLA
jgi:inorganic pyrophosphatase